MHRSRPLRTCRSAHQPCLTELLRLTSAPLARTASSPRRLSGHGISPSDGLVPSRLGDQALFPPGVVMRLRGTPHTASAPVHHPQGMESLFRWEHTRSLPSHVDAWIEHVYILYMYCRSGSSSPLFGITALPSSPRFHLSFYPAVYILFCVCVSTASPVELY